MAINPILKIIRAKKLGILMHDAREKSGKSIEACAGAMGLSTDELAAMEAGERAPTLPELEILAYYLDIPLEHFWENELLKTVDHNKVDDPGQIKLIRQKAIGNLIMQGRNAIALSIDDLAEQAGIPASNLQAYELCEVAIPLPELEALIMVLNSSLDEFEDHQGPVGKWSTEKQTVNGFLGLPGDLQDFISKPVNRPYLELAVRLSELNVEKLRALGEGLLEITL